MFLGDTVITPQELYNWSSEKIRNEFETGGPRTALMPIVDDSTSYDTFIRAFEETFMALTDIRTQALKQEYGKEYKIDAYEWYDLSEIEKEYLRKFNAIGWKIQSNKETEYYKYRN